jgi:hypothetical protein
VSGNRVFVHNLAFKTSWQDLKDHARQARAPSRPRRAPAARNSGAQPTLKPRAGLFCNSKLIGARPCAQAGEVVHAKIMEDARCAAA